MELLGVVSDIYGSMKFVFKANANKEKEKLMERTIIETIVPCFTRLQKRLEENGNNYFVGDSVCYF